MARVWVECTECQEEFKTDITGNKQYREWKIENHDWVCDDCIQKQRDEENEKCKKLNSEYGYPALIGSDKQIAWAETIRKKFNDEVERILPNINQEPKERFISKIEIDDPTYRIDSLFKIERSSWWIDNRNRDIVDLLKSFPTKDEYLEKEIEEELEKAVNLEATIRPENAKSETIAIISIVDNNRIDVDFAEKREDFRLLIKELQFSWASGWYRRVKLINGTVPDRVAEVGNRLLEAGFIIRILDKDIRDNAINGSFEPEHTRWIMKRTSGKYKGWFSFSWRRYHEDFYNEAKKITGAIWSSPNVVVRPEHFEQVLDFAEQYDFKFSKGGQEVFDAAESHKKEMLIPREIKKGKRPTKATKKQELKAKEGEVDESLLD